MGNRADVLIQDKEHNLTIPGRWRITKEGVHPLAPGDNVRLEPDADSWRIIEALPRRNEFTRQTPGTRKPLPQTLSANLNRVIIVASGSNPATPTGLIDRLLVTAELGDVPAVLLINKVDITEPERLNSLRRIYRHAVESVLLTSAITDEGIDLLRELTFDSITLLAGSSGVGKSSLANRLDPDLNLRIGEISEYSGKGRHITSAAQLHRLKRTGWIIDTPGLRECAPWDMKKQNLWRCFREFRELAEGCHFRDCMHHHEKGCNVKTKAGTDLLPEERYLSYLKLLQEAKQ